MPGEKRDIVFISHASPEDNEFARWLSLRLVNEGYKVWSDVTRLIGGEMWWNEIEEALRKGTIKFLFVLSRVSNQKDGALKELLLADTVRKTEDIKDFIVPLRLDDIPYRDMNVLIHGLNAISFTESWARGLGLVLEKLSKDGVPKDLSTCNASLASSWWESHQGGHDIFKKGGENYLSNWFMINSLPCAIYLHSLRADRWQLEAEDFPAFQTGQYVVSFASQEDLGVSRVETTTVRTTDILTGSVSQLPLGRDSIVNAIVHILAKAWDNAMSAVGLPFYTMANEKKCHYFTQAILNDRKLISFSVADDVQGKRSLVGVSKKKYWHFGISAQPQIEPVLAFIVRSHVLFSSDGANIWESVKALHRARRSTCKSWWNDEWRDRLLLSLHWIAHRGGTRDSIVLDLSSESETHVPTLPVQFESPVGYDNSRVRKPCLLDEELARMDETEGIEE